MAQHPHQPLPRLQFLFAERLGEVGNHQEVERQAAFPDARPAHAPAARAAGKGLVPPSRPVVVEVRVQLGPVRLDPGRVPQHVAVAALVHQAHDLAAQLGHHVDRQARVLEPDHAQAVVGPAVVDASAHQ